MPQETEAKSTAEAPVINATVGKKQINIEEIGECFKAVEDDIGQIGKLISEEKTVVDQFFISLQKMMQPVTSSIAVSTSILPYELGGATQANMDSNGHLTLTFEDKHVEVIDLSEPTNRDLMTVVMGDFVIKFNDLTLQIAAEKLNTKKIKEIPSPEPIAPEPPVPAISELLPTVNVETPISIPEPEPTPIETKEELVPQEVPVSPPEEDKIAQITEETLGYLGVLGNEIFETVPISKYFDDWMVNLRQVILSFESNEAIGSDETFRMEYNKIFGEIEDELAKRLADEADIEVSAKALEENRYLLKKIDEGYAAQSKDLVVKGKDAIAYLIKNVQQIEKELAEVEQIKISYRHPMMKMANDQKKAELTLKLNAAKKRLALSVRYASSNQGKAGNIDEEYEAQSRELEAKRKIAMEFLTKNVQELEEKLGLLRKFKTSNLVKKVANQQQIFEVTEKLVDAKARLMLTEQNSSAEQEQLRADYEKKKQTAIGKLQSIEKNIASKTVDGSLGARQAAVTALISAVKSYALRKTKQPQTSLEGPNPKP